MCVCMCEHEQIEHGGTHGHLYKCSISLKKTWSIKADDLINTKERVGEGK